MPPLKLRVCLRRARLLVACLLLLNPGSAVQAEAMLQLFNVNWDELAQKMPEIAEAGYTSLWLPPPAKAGSVFSVGYDLFDPFDLGDKNQRGTVRTKYGTKEQLLSVVEAAHRFGLRVYFDNIMNHRGFDIPGFNSSAPTNLYPGMVPEDFHLYKTPSGTYANWWNVSNWGNVWEVQNQPLFGLIDIANEYGPNNNNFGVTLGSTTPKPYFIRQPGMNLYYMDAGLPSIGGPWRPFNGGSGDPVAEDVNAYLVRAALWMINETKCDGFRFDAVKHVPSGFFGDTADTPNGYAGAIQTMYDYVHGYGNNVTGNGYAEVGGNRDSLFNTETARNDAMLFGEHLGEPPGYQEYIEHGMRLLNSPYHYQLNNILGNPSAKLEGLDQRDYRPYSSAFTGPESILFAQSHDDGMATRRELQNAYNFTREGLPSIYSDGYNQSAANPGEQPFPRHAYAPYLGQFGDNMMPDLAWLHHQVSRGGTRPRWSDADIVAYERYDYREVANAYNPDSTVVLFVMNDNYSGAISFDDGVAQKTEGTFYECFPVSNPKGQGLVVGFTPGSVLYQLSDSPDKSQACTRLLVRQATSNLGEAQATAQDPNPVNRKVYVGSQVLYPGGGAIELKVPAGSYVMYGYQWPEASRVNLLGNAIIIQQGGAPVPRVSVTRRDGVNGDAGFSPLYPFKMRGNVDLNGGVIGAPPDTNAYAYNIDIPVVTNGPMDILVRSDASASFVLMKLDGGTDINSQMGFGPSTGLDRRDNRPGYSSDVYLGYEQTAQSFRYGPEKFAAQLVDRNNVTSSGAETYHYTVGGGSLVVNGLGNGNAVDNSTADWVYHDPAAPNTASSTNATPTQRVPLVPGPGQEVKLYVKVGYKLRINRCFIYYTVDGSNPEGAFGVGTGTTRVVEAFWAGPDSENAEIDWWRGIIPGSEHGADTQVRYKIALFHNDIWPMTDADTARGHGLNQAAITNFNPATATVWLHNNLKTNDTATGLRTGFHMIRARPFLPRESKSSVFNTFLQTFYYAGSPPAGVIAFPAEGASISTSTYTVVVRADGAATAAEYTIEDSNGSVSGVAPSVNPDPGLNQQYPGYPREFRFTYNPVPSSGTAAITVRLKDFASTVYSNRFTTVLRTVNAQAPEIEMNLANPGADGAVLTISSNQLFSIQACYSANLGVASSNFSVYLNGVFQPRTAYIFRSSGCGTGFRTLYFNWTGVPPGSNTVHVLYTNGPVTLGDTRVFAVNVPGNTTDSDGDGLSDSHEVVSGTNPYDADSALRIIGLDTGAQTGVTWSSVPSKNYEVWASTNVAAPMRAVSQIVPALTTNTTWADPTSTNRFYRIRVLE